MTQSRAHSRRSPRDWRSRLVRRFARRGADARRARLGAVARMARAHRARAQRDTRREPRGAHEARARASATGALARPDDRRDERAAQLVERRGGPRLSNRAHAELPWFGQRGAMRREAESDAHAAGYDFESLRLDLLAETRSAFYDWIHVATSSTRTASRSRWSSNCGASRWRATARARPRRPTRCRRKSSARCSSTSAWCWSASAGCWPRG